MDDIAATLQGWQNFYFMAGGAAAGLLGLMFVAISLGLPLVNKVTMHEFNTFATPSVVYFVTALLLACAMLAPMWTRGTLALALFAGGGFGVYVVYESIVNLVRAAKKFGDFSWSDWLAQIMLPVAAYGLILVSAAGFAFSRADIAPGSLWVSMVCLLVSGIVNTWALVLWIIDQKRDGE